MNDSGDQEVIGFILAFLLSTIVLVISMQAFVATRQSSETLQTAVQLELVANRVANQVTQASAIAQDSKGASNTSYERVLRLPELSSVDYYLELATDVVWANTTDNRVAANSTTFRTSAIAALNISGRVHVQGALIKICYWKNDLGDENPANDLSYIRVQDGSKRCLA